MSEVAQKLQLLEQTVERLLQRVITLEAGNAFLMRRVLELDTSVNAGRQYCLDLHEVLKDRIKVQERNLVDLINDYNEVEEGEPEHERARMRQFANTTEQVEQTANTLFSTINPCADPNCNICQRERVDGGTTSIESTHIAVDLPPPSLDGGAHGRALLGMDDGGEVPTQEYPQVTCDDPNCMCQRSQTVQIHPHAWTAEEIQNLSVGEIREIVSNPIVRTLTTEQISALIQRIEYIEGRLRPYQED